MIPPILYALASYARVRSFPRRIRDRQTLRAWQAKRLKQWLAHDVPKVSAFRKLAGCGSKLEDLPIMEKSDLMEDFSRFNVPDITNAQGWEAFSGSRRIGDFIVGASTGTSGNRGLFVISHGEQFSWLGAILAKAVPDFWRHRDRIAVLLPLDTPLYDSANATGRLALRFFDITDPLGSYLTTLVAFDPTLLVAPPRILRRLAEANTTLRPRRIFSAAEKLEDFDRAIIEGGFGVALDEIYMATEGLLGVTCAYGRLHLTEDCMHFEFEPAGEDLVAPIISDFSRKTQIMARYRMNDLLRLDRETCPCGSPLMVVREVVGRQDDVFCMPAVDGKPVELTPDILRNAIVDTDRCIDDFLLVQTGERALELHLSEKLSLPVRQAVRANLLALLDRHGASPDCRIEILALEPHSRGKLRRIRREWAA
ncbi:MAG: CoF synthetase [Ahrensia sp.]|nr:CoF synthetase [Ahrensia sp.]